MQRKDVTPNSDKSLLQKFGIGLAGLLGGALILGGAYSGDYSHTQRRK